MWSNQGWTGGGGGGWQNPMMAGFTNPTGQVDWAALAKQWIAHQTGPPVIQNVSVAPPGVAANVVSTMPQSQVVQVAPMPHQAPLQAIQPHEIPAQPVQHHSHQITTGPQVQDPAMFAQQWPEGSIEQKLLLASASAPPPPPPGDQENNDEVPPGIDMNGSSKKENSAQNWDWGAPTQDSDWNNQNWESDVNYAKNVDQEDFNYQHQWVNDQYQSWSNDFTQDRNYSADNAESSYGQHDSIDAQKRKLLPAWIREGLEKMEREKQKEADKLKLKEEREKINREKDDEEEERIKAAGGGPIVPRKSKFDSDTESLNEENSGHKNESDMELSEDEEKARSERIRHKRRWDGDGSKVKEEPPISEEERQMNLILKVRTWMTEILIQISSEEIESVAQEVYLKAKAKDLKAPARQLAKSNALASLTMFGDEDSASEVEEEDKEEANRSLAGWDHDSDTDEEGVAQMIKQKKELFARKMKLIEAEGYPDETTTSHRSRSKSHDHGLHDPKSLSTESRKQSSRNRSKSEKSVSGRYKLEDDTKKLKDVKVKKLVGESKETMKEKRSDNAHKEKRKSSSNSLRRKSKNDNSSGESSRQKRNLSRNISSSDSSSDSESSTTDSGSSSSESDSNSSDSDVKEKSDPSKQAIDTTKDMKILKQMKKDHEKNKKNEGMSASKKQRKYHSRSRSTSLERLNDVSTVKNYAKKIKRRSRSNSGESAGSQNLDQVEGSDSCGKNRTEDSNNQTEDLKKRSYKQDYGNSSSQRRDHKRRSHTRSQSRDMKRRSRSGSRDRKRRSRSRNRDRKRRSRSRNRDRKRRSRSRSRDHKRRSRSRSRDHKRRSRSRSRDHKRRSRSRSRDRKRRSRSRSRDRKRRSRSRSRDHKRRSRSRSRDHKRRSRSRSRDARKVSLSGTSIHKRQSRISRSVSSCSTERSPESKNLNDKVRESYQDFHLNDDGACALSSINLLEKSSSKKRKYSTSIDWSNDSRESSPSKSSKRKTKKEKKSRSNSERSGKKNKPIARSSSRSPRS